MKSLRDSDKQVSDIMLKELRRQKYTLGLIASENNASRAVLEALGSVLTNKYSEGQPYRRYYGGNEHIDEIESLAVERAKRLFGVEHANVQPYSGTPANLEVYDAVLAPGDLFMGQSLEHGGHLSHGHRMSATSEFYKSVQYHVKGDGYLDMDNVRKLAREHKPKLIWCGASAYSREIPFKEFGEIADEVGAYLAADIAHIAGLIVGGAHKSPAPYAHIITTTTHKTLRGPRGAIIMVTEKGLEKDEKLPDKVDKAVFPKMQGGPHNNITAAIAVALGEASRLEFKQYAHQVVKNASAMSQRLAENGFNIVTGGTDNHLMLADLTKYGSGMGVFLEKALEQARIALNKNTIPNEPSTPFYPSGVRIGTPSVTTRGMKEGEMKTIADFISDVMGEIESGGYRLPDARAERASYADEFKKKIKGNPTVSRINGEVLELCKKFQIYEWIE